MKQKNRVYYSSIITVSTLASLFGLMTIGCTSFATSSEQQPTQGKDSPTLNPASENLVTNKGENNSTINNTSKVISAKVISANPAQGIPLKKNMAYREARLLVMQQGWQPNSQGEPPNLQSFAVKELFDLGYEEIKDCAGTGEAPCRFEFINNKGEMLVVVATTNGYENKKRFVRRWWIEKNPHITQQNSSKKIAEGIYWLGSTGQGLEVKGERYRYYDEGGEKPWKSISNLQYIKNGVLFDGETYWCLSTLAPQNQPATCSANGWTQDILPFRGTRFFNFLGGSGTGQSIMIKDDGTTTVKIHGTVNTSVEYEGKFSNPIILKDGFGLLFKDNKIYQLKTDGQIATGCKGEGKLCESDLYEP